MRIAVVGATGNAGTAVLRALHRRAEIDSIVGIARRLPPSDRAPYRGIEWESIDIGAAAAPAASEAALTQAFTGADAVIHLAWLIQPNDRRALLRRVNVEGTRRVLAAVAAAGVPAVIAASSVGAYSPDSTATPRTETWPTRGISTSHYSVDKAAQEDLLTEFVAEHPEIAVTRLRPALIFCREAASEIQRYFVGSAGAAALLGARGAPVLPVPAALAGVQAVHADDLGEAYALAAVSPVAGAFNICADDVLDARQLASAVAGGRRIPVPAALMRAAIAIGHSSGLITADPGWLDMAIGTPLMDNSRAKRELGWHPHRSAREALDELLCGFANREGGQSIPLRAARAAPPPPAPGTAVTGQIRRTLSRYLADHQAGATAGAQHAQRAAELFAESEAFPLLSQIAAEIQAERDFVAQLRTRWNLTGPPLRRRAADAAAGLYRTVGGHRTRATGPEHPLLALELLASAISGKAGLWRALAEAAGTARAERAPFDERIRAAQRQLADIARVHARESRRLFARRGAQSERAGADRARTAREEDALADEWGRESFPASDAPAFP
ncbi:NAD-dependent epimerase/dehydratase family protein [Brevibacterium sp. 5221]|uniref:NAD-dependent epimerase/dehydratase family protein n=1 Tax=Brevibacterium rongguiense TaxID=2695267 RepID=A0A6N9H555_9MICO|nr:MULTISPECIES: NAD-dependent epimerase/dehydratase family protein [Brevibacterium]MYM19023.1 NAD-dependent epimerase/dehydratase family protein [Brevibacterium rongguiense]WAL40688.1 NAD-dependent epimerase/dehydratase family protein [Brevibacterium sp. BRM-1]